MNEREMLMKFIKKKAKMVFAIIDILLIINKLNFLFKNQ